ncbi:prolyl oligopeptidase family serine peptidase [Isoptericola sediminis]|uniref:S9 family peptidase n=1 Tax=Isoptericola sediminis TaxID=2733572 RepID=A0A849KDD1_9MICO|nr:S9 family peptidase [Isoptericola sediminis]
MHDDAATAGPPEPGTPPAADRRPTTRSHHGHSFVDDYEWLRAKEDPEVLAHLEAENSWTQDQLAGLRPLRERIVGEIKDRTLETDLSVPTRLGGHWYYVRFTEGEQYPVHARVPVTDPEDWTPPVLEPGQVPAGEQVLLDQNEAAAGHDFFSLGSFAVAPRGDRLVHAVDTTGDERYTLRVRDLSTGTDLPDEIDGTFPGAVITPDGRYVFYPTVDDAWRPCTIWRHEVGTPVADDVQVFHEPDERFWVGVGLSRSQQYLQIELGSKMTGECWLLETDDPTGAFRPVWRRREGVEYTVEHAVLPGRGDALLVLHNDGAQNFELAVTDVPPRHDGHDDGGADGLDPADATVVVAHDPGLRLESVDAFADHVVLGVRRDATPRVAVVTLATLAPDAPWTPRELDFPEALFSAAPGETPEFAAPLVRVEYTSFVTPATVLDVDLATGERLVRRQQPVLGGYEPTDYAQQRAWATAEDGTRVPISLVWKRDAVTLDSAGTGADPAPLLLYGYGAYEISVDPFFSVPRLSLLDRGVVFAVAHVRGGGELGRAWYEGGRLEHKRNTFTDFVACARHLVDAGWTSPERMVADGGSAGGLLMGAVTNLAPELFAGVLAGVPFVDALTSILDPSLPLTVVEWEEWGNPLADAEVYAYMRSYSPYENVPDDASHYPRILAVTSLHDTRVLYVEPAKWVARLRAAGAPALLKIEMSAGHGGVSGRYARWEEIAFEHAWTLDVLGLADDE